MTQYCPPNNNCSLDNTTKRNINSAISLITTALTYFEADGNHLKTSKGLSFYDKITSAVNDIYTYISNSNFGDNIDLSIFYLKEGSYKLAIIARDAAEEDGACQVSNCAQLLDNANSEIGKALLDSKQKNYVYVFNHLTNAWKFAMNVMGANLKKEGEVTAVVNIPTEYGMDQNYPNPFNPSTEIRYQLPENGRVKLEIYDVIGNLITTLIDQEMNAGYHSINWNASGLSSGIYFYRISSANFVATKKLMLMK